MQPDVWTCKYKNKAHTTPYPIPDSGCPGISAARHPDRVSGSLLIVILRYVTIWVIVTRVGVFARFWVTRMLRLLNFDALDTFPFQFLRLISAHFFFCLLFHYLFHVQLPLNVILLQLILLLFDNMEIHQREKNIQKNPETSTAAPLSLSCIKLPHVRHHSGLSTNERGTPKQTTKRKVNCKRGKILPAPKKLKTKNSLLIICSCLPARLPGLWS